MRWEGWVGLVVLAGGGIGRTTVYVRSLPRMRRMRHPSFCDLFWAEGCRSGYSLAIISRTSAICFLIRAILSGHEPPVGSG